jgi:hypothetical protein
MRRPWARVAAILLILLGAVWLGQGLRLLPSAVMYGSPFWGTLGGVLLLVGLALAYWGFIRRA